MRKLSAVLFGLLTALGSLVMTSSPAAADILAANAWSANAGSIIESHDTVLLKGANTSVETTNLDFPIQSQHEISFKYELLEGAACAAGAPRIFVEVNGTFFNSWDGNPGQCGTDGVVTFKTGMNGSIGAMGVVFDQAGGYVDGSSVRVSDVRINGELVLFQEQPPATTAPPTSDPTASPDPTPSATPSPSESAVQPTPTQSPIDKQAVSGNLPVTGSTPLVLAGGGVGLLALGALLFLLGRRRRNPAPS